MTVVILTVLLLSMAAPMSCFHVVQVANMSDPNNFNKTIVDITALHQAAEEIGKVPKARTLMSVIVDDSQDKGYIVFKTNKACYEVAVQNVSSEANEINHVINKTYHIDEHSSTESDAESDEDDDEPLEIAFWLNLSTNIARRKLEVDTLCKLIQSVKIVDQAAKEGASKRQKRATRCIYVRVNKKRICKLVIIPG